MSLVADPKVGTERATGKETARSCSHVESGATAFLGCVSVYRPSRAAPATTHHVV